MFDPRLIPEKIRMAMHPPTKEILKGFEGVVWPGEMCCTFSTFSENYEPTCLSLIFHAVVLGRPGAGCSTLLKTLANQHETYRSVTGFMHYANGISPHDLHKHFRGDVVYCEVRLHCSSVSETTY